MPALFSARCRPAPRVGCPVCRSCAILLCAAFPAPEPRLILGRGIADADARIGLEREVPPVVLDPEFRAGCDIAVVERLVDLQSPGQLAGAVRAVCARADEHGLRLVHVPGHDVEHPVHAVAEVDVDRAAVVIEHLRALCAPVTGMTGRVLRAAVGFRLRDARTQQRAVRQPAHQNAPNQVRRDAEYVAPEKFPILQFPIHQLSYWTT